MPGIRSKTPIDVIIPLSPRHIPMLPLVIEGVRKYIMHPVQNIYVVATLNENIIETCKDHDLTFIEETSVLGYDKTRIDYICKNQQDRSGWLYQQLIKLYGERVSSQEKFLILDSSTVFISPKIFCHNGQDILDHSDEWHRPYFTMYERMMLRKTVSKTSFVCHYMLFDRNKLLDLKSDVELRFQKRFDEVILDLIDREECSSFSEYETYGNYVMSKWPESIKHEYWFNKRCDPQWRSQLKGFNKSISWL